MKHATAAADVVKAHAAIPDSKAAQVMPNMALISKHLSRAVQCLETSGSPVKAVQALYQSLQFEVNLHSGLLHVQILHIDSCVLVFHTTFMAQVESSAAPETEVQWCKDVLQRLDTGAPRSLAVTVSHFVNVYKDLSCGGPLGSLPGCISQEFNVRTP